MTIFECTQDAFQMLGRLVAKGKLRNFNDAIAEELIGSGYAFADGDELLPTSKGEQAARTLTWPSRQPFARPIVAAAARAHSLSG